MRPIVPEWARLASLARYCAQEERNSDKHWYLCGTAINSSIYIQSHLEAGSNFVKIVVCNTNTLSRQYSLRPLNIIARMNVQLMGLR